MEKYRIKLECYKDGSVKYYPQYYRGWFSGWKSIHTDGKLCKYADEVFTNKKESAFNAIELCKKGVNIVIAISYEYIKQ